MRKIACLLIFLLLLSCGKEKQDQRIVSIDKFMQGQAEFFKFNGNILIAEKGGKYEFDQELISEQDIPTSETRRELVIDYGYLRCGSL